MAWTRTGKSAERFTLHLKIGVRIAAGTGTFYHGGKDGSPPRINETPLQALLDHGTDLALARGAPADRVTAKVKGKLCSHESLHGNWLTSLEAS